MELVVSENFVPAVRSLWLVLCLHSVLHFWNSKVIITLSSCYATDEQKSLAAKEKGKQKKQQKGRKIMTAACGNRTRCRSGVLTRSRSHSWILP